MNYSSPEKEEIITYFTVLTSASRDVARSFLETHQWDLYAAASTFNGNQDTVVTTAEPNVPNPNDEQLLRRDQTPFQNLQINIPDSSSLSPSQPSRAQYFLSSKRAADNPCESQRIKRRQGAGNIRTLADLTGESDSDSDEPQENKGREENRATDIPEQSSRSLSKETVSAEVQEQQQDQPDDVMTSIVTLWRNGFTIGDGPFRSSDDPENAAVLESIKQMNSAGETYVVQVTHVIKLIRREEENFSESSAFQGVGRTLAGSDSVSSEPPLTTTPPPSMGLLVVDSEAPTTSIQLRFADGTSLVTLFNTHHTIRDVRGFIDASRPDGSRDYQLLIMGFPPKPLSDLDQTIDKAGIADSVLIQKF